MFIVMFVEMFGVQAKILTVLSLYVQRLVIRLIQLLVY